MAIDIHLESLLLLREVPKWCQEHLGNRVHISSVHRWRIRGVRGVKLETVLAGGRRYTSHESLQRFFARTTAAADGESYVGSSTIDEQDVEVAETYLDSEGI